ncbi:helix-turn-helix domain-containing protein [Thermodesulfobacteriota bacterium]
MIDPEKRKAIYHLHEQGMSLRLIARQLDVSRTTVRGIVAHKGGIPESKRNDKIKVDEQLLRRLYGECSGWVQRIHEKLVEEHAVQIGYSTLTRLVRELDLGAKHNPRCGRVADKPGAEMQHDTSPYRLKIAGRETRVVASLLYYRYSKIRYLEFHRTFERFKMKCFLHKALQFWEYSAPVCIIDNTNLARLRGSGKNAVIVPEMEKFARQYGFAFVCHEIKHSNRKAGNERSFWTVETNFFPGRTFESMEDLNAQAFDWATSRMANRPVSKTGLIPARAFEYEKPFLKKLPSYIPAPYLLLTRKTDQYGYAPFDANFYWVPGTGREEVTLLQYSTKIQLYQSRTLLAEYDLPPDGVKNKEFWPPGTAKPQHQPKHRHRPTHTEQQKLSSSDPVVAQYVTFAVKTGGKPKHRFIRQLYALQQKMAPDLFLKTVTRALQYRITDIQTLERIAVLLMREGSHEPAGVQIDSELQSRPSYLEGQFSDDVNFSEYEKLLDDDCEEDKSG